MIDAILCFLGVSQRQPAAISVAIIQGWNLSRVKDRMHNKRGLSRDYLNTLEGEYKKYLSLCVETPNVCLTLSEPVDDMLHEHMLFTEDFLAFQKAIGHRFRHNPTLTKEEAFALKDDYQERTIGGLTRRFGSANPQFWPPNAPICWGKLIPA